MRTYKVYIADRITKFPVLSCEVKALSKWHAKAKIFRDVCEKDRSYLLTASLVK